MNRLIALSAVLLSLCFVACGVSPSPNIATAKTIFIGDSITYVWSQSPEFEAHTNWIGKGIWGQTSTEIAARFQVDVVALHPQIVHILVGTNDVYPGWTSNGAGWTITGANNTCVNIAAMVKAAKANGITVVLGTIPPWGVAGVDTDSAASLDSSPERYQRILELNAWIEGFSVEQEITLADYHSALSSQDEMHYLPNFTTDGLHPDTDGEAAMLNTLLTSLLRSW